MKIWLNISLISLVLFGGVFGGLIIRDIMTPVVAAPVATTPAIEDKPLLTLINDLRASKDIAPLVASAELNLSAQEKADDMANQHYFGHENPQGIRGTWIIPNYLPQATLGTENLTMCPTTNLRAFQNWSNSPAHYHGMIDPRVTLYGEGKAWDDEKQCMVYVNHFAAIN